MTNPTEDLTGRAYLVTGGGSGIGAAIARTLADRGAGVTVAGRRMEKLDQVVQEIRAAGGAAYAHSMDVRDPDQTSHGLRCQAAACWVCWFQAVASS